MITDKPDTEHGNGTNTVLNTVPTYDEIMKPFEPYIKRFGFGYVHFINGTHLMAKDFGELARNLWSDNQNTYVRNVSEWCLRHCV